MVVNERSLWPRSEAFFREDTTLKNLETHASAFEKLTMPKEYGDLVTDANEPVTRKYKPLIRSLITDLDFPEKSTAFLETTEDLSYL